MSWMHLERQQQENVALRAHRSTCLSIRCYLGQLNCLNRSTSRLKLTVPWPSFAAAIPQGLRSWTKRWPSTWRDRWKEMAQSELAKWKLLVAVGCRHFPKSQLLQARAEFRRKTRELRNAFVNATSSTLSKEYAWPFLSCFFLHGLLERAVESWKLKAGTVLTIFDCIWNHQHSSSILWWSLMVHGQSTDPITVDLFFIGCLASLQSYAAFLG